MVMGTDKLEASYCDCGQVMIPPRERCIYCSRSNSGKIIEISNMGQLLSFTILNVPPEGFNSPLILGLVEIDLNEYSFENRVSRNLRSNPKLICQGLNVEVSEKDLEIDITVEILKKEDLYFFKIA
jgi:uncharacterized OB-fold protein